jgi:hypothetical protein
MTTKPAVRSASTTDTPSNEHERLATLLQISGALSSTLNAKAGIQEVLETLARRHSIAHSLVVLVDAPTGEPRQFAARVVAEGEVPDADLAVLEIRGVALPPARLASDPELAMGEDVFVVAAPYGRALSVSAGLLSQIDFAGGTSERVPAMIKTDAAIGYGASGGGIYSAASGRLLGIVEGYRTAKVTVPNAESSYSFDVPMPGETFAAPTTKIRAFLEKNGLQKLLDPPTATSAPAASRAG